LLLPVYMIAAAVYYGVIDRSGISVQWFSRLKIILAMAVLAAGIMMVKPAATHTTELLSWERYSVERLEEAIANGEPVIIDFYADWCAPCKELEHITFADTDVIRMLDPFIRLKVDMTISRPSHDALRETYNIVGVPTIVFYDRNGIRRDELRLNGFERPDDFLRRLEAVLYP
ncbi:MAG: thioredoxin family protein, partial [FCB group bacterium]|nr:thioredoxin family protein [FCB group bacterium]